MQSDQRTQSEGGPALHVREVCVHEGSRDEHFVEGISKALFGYELNAWFCIGLMDNVAVKKRLYFMAYLPPLGVAPAGAGVCAYPPKVCTGHLSERSRNPSPAAVTAPWPEDPMHVKR